MRNYEEIFSKDNQINLGVIQDLLSLDFDEFKKQLSLMEKEKYY